MIKETEAGIIFTIKVVPNSSKNDIIIEENIIKLKVTALPIDNKANKAVIEYLSKFLKVPKSSIEILKGQGAKEKKIFISIIAKDKQKEIVKKLISNE